MPGPKLLQEVDLTVELKPELLFLDFGSLSIFLRGASIQLGDLRRLELTFKAGPFHLTGVGIRDQAGGFNHPCSYRPGGRFLVDSV